MATIRESVPMTMPTISAAPSPLRCSPSLASGVLLAPGVPVVVAVEEFVGVEGRVVVGVPARPVVATSTLEVETVLGSVEWLVAMKLSASASLRC